MKTHLFKNFRNLALLSTGLIIGSLGYAQTTVYDVIAASPNHTTLKAAIDQAGLDVTLDDNNSTFTVFAPDDNAMNDLTAELGITTADLLADPNLDQILLYHVLGASVQSSGINNGDIVTPLNTANTLKLTVTGMGDVYVNQAMVNVPDIAASNGYVHSLAAALLEVETVADVAIDNGFTILTDAVVEAELLPALTDPFSSLTVFAPSDAAFNAALTELGITSADLLANPNLQNILLYHVLGADVQSSDFTNGDLATPLNTANTIKVTVTGGGAVYANQAMVVTPDVTASNGRVHAIDAVIFAVETVADVAIDNGFNILTSAVIEAELLPALTDPFASLTVFAPSDAAFNAALNELGITANDLLADPNLPNILLYHVLGAEVASSSLTNGDLATPLNTANTIKITVTGGGDVYANQAMVEMADVMADNGIVHAIDQVILTNETVVDAAIDNGFTILTDAVIEAELVPALSDPFAQFTVFAPTDAAFNAFLTAQGITAADLLADPNLQNILLYHTLGTEVLSGDLTNGPVTTLNGDDVVIDLSSGVMVNDANVVTADVDQDNGVVHAIDKVLDPSVASLENIEATSVKVFPNPAADYITIDGIDKGNYTVTSATGAQVLDGQLAPNAINVSALEKGTYIITITNEKGTYINRLVKL
ncbi:MAG: fasciclin domain-containing protein [Brumimicrobium sp.]|nr:fasciclin domain-containing protein [Brumimicrobium sp.]